MDLIPHSGPTAGLLCSYNFFGMQTILLVSCLSSRHCGNSSGECTPLLDSSVETVGLGPLEVPENESMSLFSFKLHRLKCFCQFLTNGNKLIIESRSEDIDVGV